MYEPAGQIPTPVAAVLPVTEVVEAMTKFAVDVPITYAFTSKLLGAAAGAAVEVVPTEKVRVAKPAPV